MKKSVARTLKQCALRIGGQQKGQTLYRKMLREYYKAPHNKRRAIIDNLKQMTGVK